MKKLVNILLVTILVLTVPSFSEDVEESLDKIEDRSISHEIYNPVMIYPRNSGWLLDFDGKSAEKAEKAAVEILKEYSEGIEASRKYSLYERFGADLHWYRYLGESTYSIQLLDHIYSAITQQKADKLKDLGETIFYNSDTYLSCNVYKNRPKVATIDEYKSGNYDPRVETFLNSRNGGISYILGSIGLSIGKIAVQIVSVVTSSIPIKTAYNVIENLLSLEQFSIVLQTIVYTLISLALIGFVYSIFKKGIDYIIGKGSSILDLLNRFVIGVLCIGFAIFYAANPIGLIKLYSSTIVLIDNVFNDAITLNYENDEIIGGVEGDEARAASLWKTTLFEPWVEGQFGYGYNNLYTQFSTVPESKKMKQSYTTKDKLKNLQEGEVVYNSALYTGDIFVPLGQKTELKNWAAYLYSCASKFHIDHSVLEKKQKISYVFPNRTNTAGNDLLAADVFRVIDAQMNISPQISKDGVAYIYTDSSPLKPKYMSASNTIFFNILVLMVSFIPLSFMKVLKALMLLKYTIYSIFLCIAELFKEGSGFRYIIDDFIKDIRDYALISIKIFILIIAYNSLIGKSLIHLILYCSILLMTYGIKYSKIKQVAKTSFRNIKKAFR